jgi:ElaA protein
MITWRLKPFEQLLPAELYEVLRLRQEVFILEQNCVFVDADKKDAPSLHLLGYENGELVAYSRIVPPGVIYEEPSIGRIVTPLKVRKLGYGKQLMEKSILETERRYGKVPIRIMAQSYLKKFYEGYGFMQEGEEFLEDGIPHIIMLRQAAQ